MINTAAVTPPTTPQFSVAVFLLSLFSVAVFLLSVDVENSIEVKSFKVMAYVNWRTYCVLIYISFFFFTHQCHECSSLFVLI